MMVTETQPPPPSNGDTWERGPSPWHKSAFPQEFQDMGVGTPEEVRPMGWYLVDWCGNQIGWVQDGTLVFERCEKCNGTGMDINPALVCDRCNGMGRHG